MRMARACESSVWLTLATGLPAFLSSTTRVRAFYNERVIDSHVLGNAATCRRHSHDIEDTADILVSGGSRPPRRPTKTEAPPFCAKMETAVTTLADLQMLEYIPT